MKDINLENVYVFNAFKSSNIEDIVIYKMSKESLDDFLADTSLKIPAGYKEADVQLTFTYLDFTDAILIPVYDKLGEAINVKEYISQELIDDALEEMEEDREMFAKNLEDFYKF